MHDVHSAPTVTVGIDGSPAASEAAVWAADEAAGRNTPLKLVYVIYPAEFGAVDGGAELLSTAHAALSDARRAVEATAEKPVAIQTEVLWGNPLATLIELSGSAAMVCVGSIGVEHTCHRAGSTAAALAGSARCPVAVIRQPPTAGRIVAEVDASPDNNAVLRWAMAEARLRQARLSVVCSCEPQARLNRLVDHFTRQYPDVTVESVTVPDVARYLADNAESIQLFVSGTRDRRSLGWAGDITGCSVLTVGGANL